MPPTFAVAVTAIFAAALFSGCTSPTPSTTTTTPSTVASTPAVSYQGTATGIADEKFDTTSVGAVTTGWQNLSGQWGVVANATAPSPPNAMQQTQAIPNVFNVLVDKKAGTYGNFVATVNFSIAHGDAEMTAGLAFRVVDINNYYAIDYDHNEGRWSLYKYVDGKLEKLMSTVENAPAADTDQWLNLTVKAKDNHIQAVYGGTLIIDHVEYQPTAPTVGMIGLWSRDESVVLFDDVHVDPHVTLTT